MAHTRIDRGATSHLPMCECGWRGGIALDDLDALREACAHERRAHPGETDAREALRQATRRRF